MSLFRAISRTRRGSIPRKLATTCSSTNGSYAPHCGFLTAFAEPRTGRAAESISTTLDITLILRTTCVLLCAPLCAHLHLRIDVCSCQRLAFAVVTFRLG